MSKKYKCKRRRKFFEAFGLKHTLYGWSKHLICQKNGLSAVDLYNRIITWEWDIVKALTTPTRGSR